MRVEVLVTGQYPSSCDFRDLTDCLYRIHERLVEANDYDVRVFYHTWDRPEMHNVLVPENKYIRHAKKFMYTDPLPKVHYNPYKDIPKYLDAPEWKDQLRRHTNYSHLSLDTHPQPGHITRNLQIISTAKLIDRLRLESEPPDLYIRVRWDCLLSHTVDFTRFMDYVMRWNEPVGCMMDAYASDKWLKTREKFEKSDFKIERRRDDNPMWCQRILDCVIMFKPEWFDTKLVTHWYESEQLLAAEWAWWQVLCLNERKHLNYNGGAVILRHTLGKRHVG